MAYTRTAISANRTLLEQFREMDNSLCEISSRVGRVGQILSISGTAAPEIYLAAIRATGGLHDAWSLHLGIERVLFPRMLCGNLISSEFLKRIMDTDQAIAKQFEAILTAPWPRSPHFGLQSLKSAVGKILTQVLVQIEGERASILSAISEPVDPEIPELVAI